ncbi:MAG: carbohydrate binding domain-containing protein [Anaerolineales bacterium]
MYKRFTPWLILMILISVVVTVPGMQAGAASSPYMGDLASEAATVDDFESGLPAGTDPNGISIGFLTFNDPNSSVAISTTNAPPAQVPGFPADNLVLQVETDVNNNAGYAGVVHAFENEAVDAWTPQDWSGFTGFSFWLYGNNTGSVLFVDIWI